MEKLLSGKIRRSHPGDIRDPHRQASALSDVILGGQDGLVNVLGVILGVAAATSDPRIVLVAGLAATFAESVSMGAVAYTSTWQMPIFMRVSANGNTDIFGRCRIWNVMKCVPSI
jgi:hypothetical protein